jgi:zinc transport system substrate-binding protein
MLILAALAVPAGAAPRVVTDIPPVQSIAARIMEGVGEPQVIVPPGTSPHGFAMRPSAAGLLADADVVVWIGPELTPWLEGPIEALAGDAEVHALAAAEGMVLLPLREGGPFAGHDDDHGHGHDHDHDHDHGSIDAHVWLDPQNGVAMAGEIATLLARVDPENADVYAANAEAFAAQMAALEAEITAELAPLRGRPFVVFHDAYQYFEARFDLPVAGSVSLGDADQPSAARVAEIRNRIRDDGIVCVFAEPQFTPRLVATVIEGSDARTGTLDPEGAGMELGPDLYPRLLLRLAEALADCLEG